MTHKNARNDLSAEYVREILEYSPETGEFRWKKTLSRRAIAGKKAGFSADSGRIRIGINGAEYKAHRIAWLIVTGVWPEYEIDHIDMNQGNNKWCNLRQATPSQNQSHRPIRRNSSTGVTGVCWDSTKRKWLAYINKRHIGHFSTKEEAVEARRKTEEFIHKEFQYK